MKVYKVTQQQRDELVALNSNFANWAACEYENYGVCIEEFTLEDPKYYAHKQLFDTFGITEYEIIAAYEAQIAQPLTQE